MKKRLFLALSLATLFAAVLAKMPTKIFPFAIATGLLALIGILLDRVRKLEARTSLAEKNLEEVRSMRKLLRKTQKQIDTFLYTVSHDSEDIVSHQFPEVFQRAIGEVKKIRPPRIIPPHLVSAYTMDGRIPVREKYRDSMRSPDSPLFYERAKIEIFLEQLKSKKWRFPRYGRTNLWLFEALEKYPVRGKRVVIMGSNKPWFESVCLYYGGQCTTIEYNRIHCDYPGITILTPEEYDRNPVRFDAGFSISSFEHDGLGRYGDPLNPVGDLEAMRKMKGVLEPNGLLFLAVPVGQDAVLWNANRVYGRLRFPMLLEGWEIVEKFGFEDSLLDSQKNGYEPVFVLKNTSCTKTISGQ